MVILFVFFFSSRRRHTRLVSDWSSDVCSSDLAANTNVLRDVNPVIPLVAGLLIAGSVHATKATARPLVNVATLGIGAPEIGRASCRERVEILVVGDAKPETKHDREQARPITNA